MDASSGASEIRARTPSRSATRLPSGMVSVTTAPLTPFAWSLPHPDDVDLSAERSIEQLVHGGRSEPASRWRPDVEHDAGAVATTKVSPVATIFPAPLASSPEVEVVLAENEVRMS